MTGCYRMQTFSVRVNEFYGDEPIPLELPEGWEVKEIWAKSRGTPQMTGEELRSALDNTVGSENIVEQAKGKRGRIVVTCDDLSRPTPAYRVFPFIVEQLHEAGITEHQIFILGSFGCHHPMNLDAFARKVGEEAVARFDCVNHNPYENFENLGRTSRGTPVLVNKEFA
ncbi:MAG: lactate racemase domain-containing protein, partial [Candidatus Bathyarchaeia archaeon]